MAMRAFTEQTGWETARRETRYTVASLAAEPAHAKLLKPMRDHLAEWNAIDQARRDADDAVTDANARVARFDALLDAQVDALARALRHELGRDDHPAFRRYFPEAPNTVIRLGLESEIARVAKFADVAAEHKPSKTVADVLARIARVAEQGKAALQERVEAYAEQGRVSLRVQAWKEGANARRRSVANALESHAIEHGLPSDYADGFFPPRRNAAKARAGSKARGNAGKGGDGRSPTDTTGRGGDGTPVDRPDA